MTSIRTELLAPYFILTDIDTGTSTLCCQRPDRAEYWQCCSVSNLDRDLGALDALEEFVRVLRCVGNVPHQPINDFVTEAHLRQQLVELEAAVATVAPLLQYTREIWPTFSLSCSFGGSGSQNHTRLANELTEKLRLATAVLANVGDRHNPGSAPEPTPPASQTELLTPAETAEVIAAAPGQIASAEHQPELHSAEDCGYVCLCESCPATIGGVPSDICPICGEPVKCRPACRRCAGTGCDPTPRAEVVVDQLARRGNRD